MRGYQTDVFVRVEHTGSCLRYVGTVQNGRGASIATDQPAIAMDEAFTRFKPALRAVLDQAYQQGVLKPEHPVVLIPDFDAPTPGECDELEQMVAAYVDNLRTRQPHG